MKIGPKNMAVKHCPKEKELMSPCPCKPSDGDWCWILGMEIEEKEGRKAR